RAVWVLYTIRQSGGGNRLMGRRSHRRRSGRRRADRRLRGYGRSRDGEDLAQVTKRTINDDFGHAGNHLDPGDQAAGRGAVLSFEGDAPADQAVGLLDLLAGLEQRYVA